MDKHEREQLKHDAFVEEVSHGLDYASSHKKQLTLYGSIAAVVVAGGLGWWWWSDKQAAERQTALESALQTQQAAIGPGDNPFIKVFKTKAEKDAAIVKEFGALAAKYPGKFESTVSQYYVGITYADQGNFPEAEKHFQSAVDGGDKEVASLARYALVQIYLKQNKQAEAEKLLRYLAENPTTMMSKENAQIELAKLLAKSNPAEAQKLLEPLRQMTARAAVSRWAITAFSETRPAAAPK